MDPLIGGGDHPILPLFPNLGDDDMSGSDQVIMPEFSQADYQHYQDEDIDPEFDIDVGNEITIPELKGQEATSEPSEHKFMGASFGEIGGGVAHARDHIQHAGFTMFNPVTAAKPEQSKLSREQNLYIARYCKEFVSDDYIDTSILEASPIPDLKVLDPLRLDSWLEYLMPKFKASAIKARDKGFQQVAKRARNTFGPLADLWRSAYEARENYVAGNVVQLDIGDMCSKLDQTVLLVSQTLQSIEYQRRLNVLPAFFPEESKRKELLARNAEMLSKTKDDLFGQAFHLHLAKTAKIQKQLRQAKSEFFQSAKRKRSFDDYGSVKVQAKQPRMHHERQPFRELPSSRGAHHKSAAAGAPPKQGGRGGGAKPRFNRYVSKLRKFGFKLKARAITARAPVAQGPGHDQDRAAGKFIGRGQIVLVSPELGEDHLRSGNLEYGKRDGDRMGGVTSSWFRGQGPQILPGTGEPDSGRSGEVTVQRGDSGGYTFKGAGSIPYFPGSQTWGGETYGIQHQEDKQTGEIPSFQDGGHSRSVRYPEKGRLHGKDRSEGCFLLDRVSREGQKVHEVPVERETLRVQGCPDGPRFGAAYLHKVIEASGGSVTISGNENHHLFRRPSVPKPGSAGTAGTGKDCDSALEVPGFFNKLGQVSAGAQAVDGVPGVHGGLPQVAALVAEREVVGYSEAMQVAPGGAGGLGQETGEDHRQDDSGGKSHFTSTVAVPPSSEAEGKGSASGLSKLRIMGSSDPGVQGRAQLVAGDGAPVEWQSDPETKSGSSPHDNDGQLHEGLGRRIRRINHTGSVDRRGEDITHQCPRDESSILRSEGFHKGGLWCSNPCESGQHYDHVLHQQDGGHEVSADVSGGEGPVGLLSEQGDYSSGEPHQYTRQLVGGQGKSSVPRPQQLAVEERVLQVDRTQMGTSPDGPVRGQDKCAGMEVCKLESRSVRSDNRCIHDSMGQRSELCISSFLPVRQMSGQGPPGQSVVDPHSSSMEHSTVLRGTNDDGERRSNLAASRPRTAQVSNRGVSSASGSRSETSRLESFREARGSDLLSVTRRLLDGARRQSTKTTYDSSWGVWVRWCVQQQVDPMDASVEDVMNFLACICMGKFEEKFLEYQTINVYRSSISSRHPKIDGHAVGSHPSVIRLMKGIFHEKPPAPKYPSTWDVGVVLNYLLTRPENEDLSFSELTHKLVMLMALVSASRSHELHALKLDLMQNFGDRVVFHIDKLTKSKRKGREFQSLEFCEYTENVELDVVDCLREYLRRSDPLRISQAQKSKLFIACVKPHNPVVSCTIARWLKQVMKKAGIDVSKYKAHSVRGASTSKAKAQGMSTEEIMQLANWSDAKVFFKFYHREARIVDKYQEKVLKLLVD